MKSTEVRTIFHSVTQYSGIPEKPRDEPRDSSVSHSPPLPWPWAAHTPRARSMCKHCNAAASAQWNQQGCQPCGRSDTPVTRTSRCERMLMYAELPLESSMHTRARGTHMTALELFHFIIESGVEDGIDGSLPIQMDYTPDSALIRLCCALRRKHIHASLNQQIYFIVYIPLYILHQRKAMCGLWKTKHTNKPKNKTHDSVVCTLQLV